MMLKSSKKLKAHQLSAADQVPAVVSGIIANAPPLLGNTGAAPRSKVTCDMTMKSWLKQPFGRCMTPPDIASLVWVRGKPRRGSNECSAPESRTVVEVILESSEVDHKLLAVKLCS